MSGDSSSEDDIPLARRFTAAKQQPKSEKSKPEKRGVKRELSSDTDDDVPLAELKRRKVRSDTPKEPSKKKSDKEAKWQTLVHSGLLFPPDYVPHGVQMEYDGVPVTLTAEQEEVASFYAAMLETAYIEKDKFRENFWAAWQPLLGKKHTIQSLEKCNFRPILEHFEAAKEKKKALSREEKLKAKELKEAAEAKYKVAYVDGKAQQVGNFRVEPPGLFRGRGDHPKMGCLKRRIYPRDIVINIGEGEPIPEHPYPGQQWQEVRHDHSVTWLAYWKDPVLSNSYKYVFLGANSDFKSESDLAKYEKARKLKGLIDHIRDEYKKAWRSSSRYEQQMGVALYFIDSLALRAGHEKDEDEADTVGCCTLKVGNVEVEDGDKIKLDFLGKDSIKYENTVTVVPEVWKLVKRFCEKDANNRAKSADDQLFEAIDATDLNAKLKDFMPELSIKVFRTFNASITLDNLLYKETASETVEEKKADYDRANKEVAILCNHQRSVPKGHGDQMQKLAEKLQAAQADLDELTLELKVVQGKVPASKLADPDKRLGSEVQITAKIAKKKAQLLKIQLQERSKEDLKTVALGTSKINYLDPRITVAWCKRYEVPIEKIFNKSLLTKFHWAMGVELKYSF